MEINGQMCIRDRGIVSCDTGKVSTKEERLDWPVTEEERNSDKGWGRFGKEQICRLKIRRMKEERAKDLVVRPWCISEIVNAHEDCPELQAVLEEYHKPVVIQDQVLGELTLDKNYDTFEGEIQWCGKDVSLSLEVNAESKPSWTRARSAVHEGVCDTARQVAFPGTHAAPEQTADIVGVSPCPVLHIVARPDCLRVLAVVVLKSPDVYKRQFT